MKKRRESDLMKALRAYIDTSVFGGYFDELFATETRAFLRLVQDGKVAAVVSDMVAAEIGRAPKHVQRLLEVIIRNGADVATATEDAVNLQEAYLKGGVLGRRWEDDAMHVAMATLSRVDVIASWNFKHLLDPRRVRAFNGVNLSLGYGLVSILSPADIVHLVEAQK